MTVVSCSVASVSPGVLLNAGDHQKFMSTPQLARTVSELVSDGADATKVSASWSCDARVQCNGASEDSGAPDLSTKDTKISFCFAANPLPSAPKAKWLMLFIEITTVYCRNHRRGINTLCV